LLGPVDRRRREATEAGYARDGTRERTEQGTHESVYEHHDPERDEQAGQDEQRRESVDD
jgi:hypothetical protein